MANEHESRQGPAPGPPVDTAGNWLWDPSKNVLDLVHAAVKRIDDMSQLRDTHSEQLLALMMRRQDDLRAMESTYQQQLSAQRSHYEELLQSNERERLNAIRVVDVNAVSEASRVAAAQAITLATQVQTSAETLRTQVATVATATATALANALEPLQKAIEDLRKTQYAQQGEKSAQTENKGSNQWAIAVSIGVFVFFANAMIAVLLHFLK